MGGYNTSKFNWQEIQNYYNDNNSLRECLEKFKLTWGCLWQAKAEKLFITRNQVASQNLKKIRGTVRCHSEATKKKMSKIRIKYLKEHPDQVPYKLNHYSKRTSYGERYFIDIFEKEQISLKHHLQVGLYQLDFYNEELKIYFEVDGDQHYLDKRIVESDIRRNAFFTERGWIGMRLRWSTYQRLSHEQKIDVVNRIKQFIVTNNRSIPLTQIM